MSHDRSTTGSAKHQLGNAGNAKHQLGNEKDKDAELVLGAPSGGAPGGAPREGWYSRGYLPHRDESHLIQSLTFRLADSLPQEKLRELEYELEAIPVQEQEKHRYIRIEAWLDAGMGCCALKHPELAEVMEYGFLLNDGIRYNLLAWCVMPNHVHILIEPLVALETITKSWKSYSGRWAMAHNLALGLGISGKSLWQREVWDRYIRNEQHFRNITEYIHNNPVKAGLCKKPEDWRWSSAWEGRQINCKEGERYVTR